MYIYVCESIRLNMYFGLPYIFKNMFKFWDIYMNNTHIHLMIVHDSEFGPEFGAQVNHISRFGPEGRFKCARNLCARDLLRDGESR